MKKSQPCKWHKFAIQCPVCNTLNFKFELFTNANAEFMVRAKCAHCKLPLNYKGSMVSLVFRDKAEDLKEGGLSEIQ